VNPHNVVSRNPFSPVAPEILQQLQASLDLFLRKRDEKFVKEFFSKHSQVDSSSGKMIIFNDRLKGALGELGIMISDKEAGELAQILDVDGSGGLDLNEFQAAVLKPPSNLDQWVATLPVSDLLARCLQVVIPDPDKDQLREMSRLSAEKVEAAAEAASLGLKLLLAEAQAQLKLVFAKMDAKARERDGGSASKFTPYKMSTGFVKDYFSGLVGRVGEFLTCFCLPLASCILDLH
jgi:hypothetical protein